MAASEDRQTSASSPETTKIGELDIMESSGAAFLACAMGIGVMASLSTHTLSTFVSVAYPFYASLHALNAELDAQGRESADGIRGHDSASSGESVEVQFWLKVWVVTSFLLAFDAIAEPLMQYVPFYYAFKVASIVYTYYPSTRGADWLYDEVLYVFLSRLDAAIDWVRCNAAFVLDVGQFGLFKNADGAGYCEIK